MSGRGQNNFKKVEEREISTQVSSWRALGNGEFFERSRRYASLWTRINLGLAMSGTMYMNFLNYGAP